MVATPTTSPTLPYVGPILPGVDSICVATGFDKWGMSNGPAAALALATRSPHELSGITTAAQANLEVGFNLAKGWVTPSPRRRIALRRGAAWSAAHRGTFKRRAMSTASSTFVSPVCPHLGGIVNWNDADQSWECPLHGSRFAPDGTLLEGPATGDLPVPSDGKAPVAVRWATPAPDAVRPLESSRRSRRAGRERGRGRRRQRR